MFFPDCIKKTDERSKLKGSTLIEQIENTPESGPWKRTEIKRYNKDELYSIIDGGATLYLDHGLKNGIYIVSRTNDGKEYELFVHSFPDKNSVMNLFLWKADNLSKVIAVEGYDFRKVRVSPAIGAILIFGIKGHYYFELNVSGFANTESAVHSVRHLLEQLIRG
jgi:hypothetical protein